MLRTRLEREGRLAWVTDEMKSLICELKHTHDFVLIDCPAGIDGTRGIHQFTAGRRK